MNCTRANGCLKKKMCFVEQVKKAMKSNSTIIITSEKFEDSDLDQDDVEQSLEESIPAAKPSKRKKVVLIPQKRSS